MPRIALILSVALHAALGMWVEVRAETTQSPRDERADAWAGAGFEIDTGDALPPSAAVAKIEPARAETSAPNPEPSDTPKAPSARAVVRSAPKPSATSPSVASSTTGTTDGATSSGAPAFGAEGLPVGVRHLPKAFTRALGIASRGDKRWLTLPLGVVGEARIELTVDAEGRLGELEIPSPGERERLDPAVRHLLDNARLLLSSGRFSLDPKKASEGVQRLRVRVELRERTASADPNADPEHEYEAPTPGHPGHGSFTLEGGRRVTTWVTLI